MDTSPSEELDLLKTLVEQINSPAGCILVLGPRVAVRPSDESRRPLDEILAGELLENLHETTGEVPPSLRHAAELYIHRNGSRTPLERAARDFYARETATTTDFHRNLANLPFRLCVSASPGHQMMVALKEAGKNPSSDCYHFKGGKVGTRADIVEPTAANPLVYYLFGDHEIRQSMCLTEMDLIDYLVTIVRGEPKVPDVVRSMLADPDASFLFLGFGFHNWYSRVLLKVLNVYGHNDKPVAFEDPEFFHLPEHPQTTKFFSGPDRLITFRHLRWEQFARELRQTYDEASAASGREQPARTQPPSAAGTPCAFLSYASEDRADVDRLREKLEARGVRVWQDRQNLRAGDRWNEVLLKVIRSKVDYVVVVQTQRMTRAISGVFHREIEAARERQAEMGDFEEERLRFLIPVTIGACEGLSALEDLHMIDVGKPDGVEDLAQSILEDWEKRHKKQALEMADA
jgi:hypothetical protein